MKKNAFSLIEVLIFISILGIFFTAAITVSVASLRNMKATEHKILATRYAEELSDWLRSQKDIDWPTFTGRGDATYCFNTTPISDTWPAAAACADNSLGSIYKREVVLTNTGTPVTSTTASITVEWNEFGTTQTVPLNTIFSLYEQ